MVPLSNTAPSISPLAVCVSTAMVPVWLHRLPRLLSAAGRRILR